MKHFGKRIAALAVSAMTLVASFAGCTASGTTQSGSSSADSGKVQIQFWHSMSGNTQEALDTLVAGFNESQDQYEVVATNQGSYDESTGKFFQHGQRGRQRPYHPDWRAEPAIHD